MARPIRLEFPGALYHVMARGNAREAIFLDDQDRQFFLDGLSRVCERFDWALWAYCLMDNHYHFLVETRQPTLSRGMREVNGVYTQGFNRRRGRVGHVLQGRYKALLVDADSYLAELSRYIVLNPVRAGVCTTAADWPWSSYAAVMGKATPLPGLQVEETLALFGAQWGQARRAFSRFVAEGVGVFDPVEHVASQVFLGDEDFVARVTREAARPSREVPKKQRAWTSVAQIARQIPDRKAAIRAAYATGTFTLAEIGEHFGLHYATVSRIARETGRADV
jgi:REP element-mobilizing transposase RayT